MSFKHSAEVLSSVPQQNATMMSLMEKIYVSDMLYSNMSYSAVDQELNVNNPINLY